MKSVQLIINSKNCHGITLVELMIASFIGLMVLAGSAAVYLASKQSTTELERMAKMTESSRFAMQMISSALQQVGFMGELPAAGIVKDSNLGSIAADCSGPAAAYNLQHYLYATISDANGHAFGCVTDAMPGTTVLVLKNVRSMRMTDSDDDGILDNPQFIDAKQIYVVANNIKGVLFDGADQQPSIIDGGDVPGGHGWIYEPQIFYIRNKKSLKPQLSRKLLRWNGSKMAFITEDLVTGIEQMSLLLALDINADGEIDSYRPVPALSMTDWHQVKAIEINVLIKSDNVDPRYKDTKIYKLAGLPTIGPKKDSFHRMVIEHTVLLRNPDFVIRAKL